MRNLNLIILNIGVPFCWQQIFYLVHYFVGFVDSKVTRITFGLGDSNPGFYSNGISIINSYIAGKMCNGTDFYNQALTTLLVP